MMNNLDIYSDPVGVAINSLLVFSDSLPINFAIYTLIMFLGLFYPFKRTSKFEGFLVTILRWLVYVFISILMAEIAAAIFIIFVKDYNYRHSVCLNYLGTYLNIMFFTFVVSMILVKKIAFKQ